MQNIYVHVFSLRHKKTFHSALLTFPLFSPRYAIPFAFNSIYSQKYSALTQQMKSKKKGKSLVKFNVAKQILTHLFLLFYSLKLKSDCLFIFKINKEGKLPRLKEKEVYPRTRRALFFILCKDFFFCGIKMTDKSRLYCHVVNIHCGGKFLQEMWREIFLLGVIERRA